MNYIWLYLTQFDLIWLDLTIFTVFTSLSNPFEPICRFVYTGSYMFIHYYYQYVSIIILMFGYHQISLDILSTARADIMKYLSIHLHTASHSFTHLYITYWHILSPVGTFRHHCFWLITTNHDLFICVYLLLLALISSYSSFFHDPNKKCLCFDWFWPVLTNNHEQLKFVLILIPINCH